MILFATIAIIFANFVILLPLPIIIVACQILPPHYPNFNYTLSDHPNFPLLHVSHLLLTLVSLLLPPCP